MKPDNHGTPAKPDEGPKPAETDQPPPPGEGSLPPVPEGPDLPPRRQQYKRQRYEDGNVPRQVPGGITDI